MGRVHLPDRGLAARSRADPELPTFAAHQEPAVGARVPDDKPCVSPLRHARARAARATPLARPRGPFRRREARPSLVGVAHGRPDAPVAPALRRGRRRRPPGRRAAVGPRVALVAGDGDGLGARRGADTGRAPVPDTRRPIRPGRVGRASGCDGRARARPGCPPLPFDRLVSDRNRAEALWDFRYRLEMFVPKAKREFGYYVLPLLVGDKLVGRAEPLFDKDGHAGTARSVGRDVEARTSRT